MTSSGKAVWLGCGVAGGFLALRALQLGLRPTLIRTPAPAVRGVEIIPASAGRLLEALDLGEVLASIGAGLSDGMTRRFADGTADVAPGRSLNVERLALRARVLAEAVRRGARVRDVDSLPPPDLAAFSVDATGQRAAWSRPLVRRGQVSADVFAAERIAAPGASRLALLDRGWAYLAADRTTTTVGVVGRNRQSAPAGLDADTRRAIGLAPDVPFRFVGRRPAFVQWAAEPAAGRRLAIGDAAFHHDPIGGRGIAFALGSAFAAAAVLATWRDDPAAEANARAYYQDYVAAEARRHLAFLAGEETTTAPEHLPEHIRWTAPGAVGALAVDARVVAGEVFSLSSGAQLRWAGGLDLALLRDLTVETVPSTWVVERLCAAGLAVTEARRVLVWAIRQGLIEKRIQAPGAFSQ